MVHSSQGSLLLLAILLVSGLSCSQALHENGPKIKSATFLSPEFVLGPGSVENRYYYNIDFPRGHIALKSFDAEVIDVDGNPVPLHETYLHHWVVAKYYQQDTGFGKADYLLARNGGICQGSVLGQHFGLGSETRRTATYVPDPYGIEIGNPAETPEGYEERWMLNVHAIDTRGVEDRLGCTECRCDLYNITVDEYGRHVSPAYKGGLACCYDHTQCKVNKGFEGSRRSLYLQYKVTWIDWDDSILPVKIFIFDVTDTGKRHNGSTGLSPENGCQVEYDVEPCSMTELGNEGCIDNKRTSLIVPTGGYVIYGVAHQHTGGIGSALYGEDERVICTSIPTYGEGKEAGNEAGYIVGMSTCYPEPGSVKIATGENLILESNYSRTIMHTGVMGLFYILVADQLPTPMPPLHAYAHAHESAKVTLYAGAIVVLLGMAITVAIGVRSQIRKGREDGYQQIVA